MERWKGISAVIPVYNSAEMVATLVERIESVLEPLADAFEIVLINDGSRDASWERIAELAAKNPRVRGLNLMRNYGQHNALLAGIRAARYEVIATLDDDLQNPPEEIPRLLEKMAEGYDVVYGCPREEKHGILRDLASVVTKQAMTGVLGAETARYISAFRVFHTRLRDAFAAYGSPYVSVDVLLTWGTSRFTHVIVEHSARRAGASNYTVRKLIRHTFNMMTGFSTLPLKLASLMGFLFTLFGAVLFLYVMVRWLISGSTVPGFPFLAAAITIFSGVQLFTLGIMGEYIGRIHVRTQNQPSYQIREQTRRPDE
jgi:glycosyltransferase involved in cell wall biosynthesis